MQSSSLNWKNEPRSNSSHLHSICSYMAMFPPALPRHFISKYSNEGELVLDPFSGRGTTVLEACLMNRIGIGNDKNPLAYTLTKAKSNIPQKGRIISRIEQLRNKFDSESINIKNEEGNIKMIFSDSTLKQLAFLKNNLNWRRSNVDAFITSMILGILHGNSEGFLSLSMPNTFSMSPNYVKNFIKEHNLQKPKRDVFNLLNKKLMRCYISPLKKGKVYSQDVRRMTKIKSFSIDLIVTSPPYTRVIRYGQFNWIRLWFLDKEAKEVDKKLFFSQSMPKYCDFMMESLSEMKRVLKPEGKAVLIIGDVNNRITKKPYNLAGKIWKECAKPLGFKLVEPIQEDVISDSTKVSRIWGKTRGNATKIDRILVLEKN